MLVGEELPDSVGGEHEELVFWFELVLCHFRVAGDAALLGDSVPKTSAHCKAGDVCIFHPDSGRPNWGSIEVKVSLDTASRLLDPFLFLRQVWLMVVRKPNALFLLIRQKMYLDLVVVGVRAADHGS